MNLYYPSRDYDPRDDEMDAQEYAMSGLETHHQQLAADAAEERDEQERKRRSRHSCSWCGERLDPIDFYRLERMDGRLHMWTERFCSLGHAALWIGE